MSAVVLVVAIALLALAAWLRAAVTSVTRIRRGDALRAESDGVRGADRVARLLDERELINPAVSVVAVALLVLASVLAAVSLASGEGRGGDVPIALATGLIAFLVGDLLPRWFGRRYAWIAYRSAAALEIVVRLGRWANDLLPDTENGEPSQPTGPSDPGQADEQERELIDSVLEFGETLVREVMTPRLDMVTVPLTATIEELVAVSAGEGYSRLPVTDNGDVVGVVIVKDLLPMLAQGRRPASIREVMRAAEFVPETKLASSLLAEMQEQRSHQAIVVDEYGDVVGLVTIEDLIEELVGEITDETDDEESFVMARSDGTWDVDGRVTIEDLSEAIELDLPDVEWDTVGGLLLGLAERVPQEGEEFDFGPLRFTVTQLQGRRVSGARVRATNRVEQR